PHPNPSPQGGRERTAQAATLVHHMPMIKRIERWAHTAMAAIRDVSGVMLLGSAAVKFANSIGRYIFSLSMLWRVEVTLILMIAFLIAILLLGRGTPRHDRIASRSDH